MVVGQSIRGVELDEMQFKLERYVERGLLRDGKSVSVTYEHGGFSDRQRSIRVCLPCLPVPFSIHENSLSNIHNSFMSRNNRRFIKELNQKKLKSLLVHGSTFLQDMVKCTDLDVIEESKYLASRKWGAVKMRKWVETEKDQFPNKYMTNGFVKWEPVYKTVLAAPRLINNPTTVWKNSFGHYVYSYTNHIKRYLRFGSVYNMNSQHIQLLWTSGLNRDKMGQLETDILSSYDDDDEIMEAGTDFSKYESTQVSEIMINLDSIYKNTTRGELRRRLRFLAKAIRGRKVMFATVDFLTNIYRFEATRTSGDITTTLGNTMLLFLIGDWIFRSLPKAEKKKIYLMASGDDGRFIFPKKYLYILERGCAELKQIGMKLDMILADSPELTEYNSSVMLRCQEEVSGLVRYHASAKLGRLLAKVGFCVNQLTGKQLNVYRYQKLLSVVNELQLYKGPHEFYTRLLDKYIAYKEVKPNFSLRWKDLVTSSKIKPTPDSDLQICNRYGITLSDWELFNNVFASFDTTVPYLTDNAQYNLIAPIMKKIITLDVVKYEGDDVHAFRNYFDPDFLDRYVQYFS